MTRAWDGQTARTLALKPDEQTRRIRDERDAYANRLTAAERDNARLRAENATLLRIVADAFADAFGEVLEPKPETEETR